MVRREVKEVEKEYCSSVSNHSRRRRLLVCCLSAGMLLSGRTVVAAAASPTSSTTSSLLYKNNHRLLTAFVSTTTTGGNEGRKRPPQRCSFLKPPLVFSTNSRELRFIEPICSFSSTTTAWDKKYPTLHKSATTTTTTTTAFHPVTSSASSSSAFDTRAVLNQIHQSTRSTTRVLDAAAAALESNNVETTKTSHPLLENNKENDDNLVEDDEHKEEYCISLTPEEDQLFTLLRTVVEERQLKSTLRVAGGWVRDKLLADPRFTNQTTTTSSCYLNDDNMNVPTSSSSQTVQPSFSRQGTKRLLPDTTKPVDIDVALDDMLGREFAQHVNTHLSLNGQDMSTVGLVSQNPEKSKHLETATMKLGPFWIDFVNLRAEAYSQTSRIPDLMRIGSPSEDAFRRDLTVNALFYNIQSGRVEDYTGRGLRDLRRGVISTPLAPLETLLDDPLRVLRSIRFAARFGFQMDAPLVEAAGNNLVHVALDQKVSKERVGNEVNLMLQSPDPVGAMRWLVTTGLAQTVFSLDEEDQNLLLYNNNDKSKPMTAEGLLNQGLLLLSTAHEYLCNCKDCPPTWCSNKTSAVDSLTTTTTPPPTFLNDLTLLQDEESRRLLWYACFLKPTVRYIERLRIENDEEEEEEEEDTTMPRRRKVNRSTLAKILVNQLKRPARDAQIVDNIFHAANNFTKLLASGGYEMASAILVSEIAITPLANSTTTTTTSTTITNKEEEQATKNGKKKKKKKNKKNNAAPVLYSCTMNGQPLNNNNQQQEEQNNDDDDVWKAAMEFRLQCCRIMETSGRRFWRAALVLSLAQELVKMNDCFIAIEGDVRDCVAKRQMALFQQYDTLALAMQRLGITTTTTNDNCDKQPCLLDGNEIKQILTNIPKGPAFGHIVQEQRDWMIMNPQGDENLSAKRRDLANHLKRVFADYV